MKCNLKNKLKMKIQDQVQIRNAELKSGTVNEEDRTAVFAITSEDVDSFRTVFKASGWDFNNYRSNPVVAYNHRANDANPDNIIGTTEAIWMEGTTTYARVKFEDAETNPLAEKVFRKVKNGTLRMASINAYIDEARMGISEEGEDPEVVYFTKQRLAEWSVVSIGSNPAAFRRNEENLQTLRSAVYQEETDSDNSETDKKRALTRFDAQLIVNQNRLVK